jgi:dipeptidyl aminopeptidase/acylaminoacyl peptidase
MRPGTPRLLCAALMSSFLVATSGQPQAEEDPHRPGAISVEGVPAIPAPLAAEIKRYQEIRSASFVGWNPRGGAMLIATRPGNLYQLHEVREPGTAPRELTAGDEPVRSGLHLRDGTLVFSRARGGDENYQLFRLGQDGAAEALLTDGTSRHLLGEPHPDGRRIAMTSTRRNGRDEDLYLLDALAGGEPELLLEVEHETWSVDDWSPDGSRAILRRYISHNESYAVIFELEGRKMVELPAETGGGRSRKQGRDSISRRFYRFGREARSIFFASDARGEFRELARLELATGDTIWLSGDLPWDVEGFAISPDRRRAAFSVNAEGFSRLYLLEELDAEKPGRREIELPPCIIEGLEFDGEGKRLGFTLGRPSAPAEAHSIEVDSGKLSRWTSSERAGFEEADFVEPRLFRFRSFDGREVPSFAYLPPASRRPAGGKLPVIILIHGGPEGQSRPWFSNIIQYYLRELGAAVLTPNVRGSTGYGKTYSLLDNGPRREDSVRDIGALLDWIVRAGAKEDGLDPGRVAVIGGSYGGYMVLASLIHFGEKLRAGVSAVGISDFITFLENTSAYRRDLRRAEYGDERDPEMRRIFERISPARRIHELRSALLLIHGANDPRVPFSETLQVIDRARSSGQPVWTVYASNEGHGFTRRENLDYQQAATALFLRRFLLAGEVVEAIAESGPALHARAGELFKLRRFREAVAAYDRAIAAGGAHTKDSCWERGLACYYAGDFACGQKQFEGYHTVGPLDIENGIWRWLCIAEAESVEKAIDSFYTYPRKVRPPFPALHALYAGTGGPAAVLAEAAAVPDPGRTEAVFYGHYYIGKHLEARGKRREALEAVEAALEHRIAHFMYDCAVIDRDRLRAALEREAR